MAPGRKKGSRKKKAKNQLRLGDLVLAKVKGFPMWPAKISRPEDWNRVPDPKKHFVFFYGTKEIAFVSPKEVQAFTNESKAKMLERCQSKSRFFIQAVKEICEEYEQLIKGKSIKREKRSGLTDEIEADAEGGLDDAHAANGQQSNEDSSDHNESTDSDSNKGSSSCDTDNRSPTVSAETNDPISDGVDTTDLKLASNSDAVLPDNTNTLPKFEDRSPTISAETNDPISNGVDTIEIKPASNSDAVIPENINTLPKSEDRHMLRNGNKTGMVFVRTKKKIASANSVKGSELLVPKDKTVDEKLCKEDSLNKDTSIHDEKKSNQVNVSEDSATVPSNDTSGNAQSVSVKKNLKCFEKRNRRTSKAPAEALKSDADGEKKIKETDSSLSGKSDVDLGSHDAKFNVSGSRNTTSRVMKAEKSGNEDIQDSRKRKRPLHCVKDPSVNVNVEGGTKDSLGKSGGTIARASGSHVPKRRAVCLVSDEEDDAEPKTPVHGRSANNARPHSQNKRSDANSISATKSHRSTSVESKTAGLGKKERNSIDEKTPYSGKSVSNTRKSLGSNSVIDFREENLLHVEQASKKIEADLLRSPQKLVDPKIEASSSKRSPSLLSTVKTLAKPQLKSTPKAIHRLTETTAVIDSLSVIEPDIDGRISSLLGSRTPDSAISMKDLIAAAQAKRKQAHSHHLTLGNSYPFFAPTMDVRGNTPSPLPSIHPLPGSTHTFQSDAHNSSLASPSNDYHTRRLEDEDSAQKVDHESKLRSSSLSGGTEAVVARDAFEGMIETLSRTKESIGRATRLAIDCAKYGIANEVVELLIKKLENESSLHRKVDLFFLVDSITQCSHNQKGIAGASYVPTVESALQRLLSAAAPPGSSARENRRQCLKVLKLWLERKIFPDSLLKRYMDDIKGSNDDTSGSFSLKRPSRAERSVDDPIREMEGLHVDEYGSNATFQIPGFLSSNVFEEEEEEDEDDNLQPPSPIEVDDASHLHTSPLKEMENPAESPDKRHCILKDVDGELEMEDVICPPKAESPLSPDKLEPNQNDVATSTEPAESHPVEPPDESPPLPPNSPPPAPPLPTSPPPPRPPLPPPPPSSAAFPPPSCPAPPPPIPVGPPLPQHPLPLVPPQAIPIPTQPSVQSSPIVVYQPSVPRDNQANPIPLSEPFPHQPPHFTRPPSAYNHPFQPNTTPFTPRPMHPPLPPPGPPHFPYPQRPFPRPFHLPPHQETYRPFMDNQNLMWMNGRGPQGVPFGPEGYFRPPGNNMNFPLPSTNNLSSLPPGRPDIPPVNCWRPT